MTARNDITGDQIRTKVITGNYRSNYDAIFRKEELERCPYCGIRTDDPCCDEPQNNFEKAINLVYGAWLNDLNSR